MKKSILSFGKALNKAAQKSVVGGTGFDSDVRCKCNGFDLGVAKDRRACDAACLRCVTAGPCAV